MFTFKSLVIPKNIWKLCFRDKKEITKIFYKNKISSEESQIYGVIDYVTSTIYIDKELDGFLLAKTLRHELTHIYLWETGQQNRIYNEEEICNLISVASPIISKTVDEIIFRLKEGLYKKGEE